MSACPACGVDGAGYRALKKIIRELTEAGWTHEPGAERWKPPLNRANGDLWLRLIDVDQARTRAEMERSHAIAQRDKANAQLAAIRKMLNE